MAANSETLFFSSINSKPISINKIKGSVKNKFRWARSILIAIGVSFNQGALTLSIRAYSKNVPLYSQLNLPDNWLDVDAQGVSHSIMVLEPRSLQQVQQPKFSIYLVKFFLNLAQVIKKKIHQTYRIFLFNS